MLKKLFNIIVIVCLLPVAGIAQELNCIVTIRHDKITGVDPQVFVNMQQAISSFMNAHKWTTDQFQTNEKIDCTVAFNLTAKLSGDNDGYEATMSIQASRPVYNTNYQSTTINFQDRDVQFHYDQYNPLVFEDNNVAGSNALVANLPAVLAYYAYLIIGLDYDSFSLLGGSDYLKKAQNVVNNAPDDNSIKGWKAVQGNKNRYWIIDQLLSPRFQDVRSYWYTYHREGLDAMYSKPDTARQKILNGISKLSEVNKDNPSSILIQFFFNAKSDEFVKILSQMPKDSRTQYINMLSQMDVADIQKYSNLR
ncbi:MAG TPA: DUF4835 family protein [Flavipsychrobacter sp.]|nr:DUF4835 family protein [Flavipsychrobacter sp.]